MVQIPHLKNIATFSEKSVSEVRFLAPVKLLADRIMKSHALSMGRSWHNQDRMELLK